MSGLDVRFVPAPRDALWEEHVEHPDRGRPTALAGFVDDHLASPGQSIEDEDAPVIVERVGLFWSQVTEVEAPARALPSPSERATLPAALASMS